MDGDERGVSPVISTILLVAVVVVLASVVSAAVWATFSDEQADAPLTDHSIVLTDEHINISHLGGESIPLSELRVIVRNSTTSTTYSPTTANLSDASDLSFDPGETWARNHSLQIQPGGSLEAVLVHQPSNTLLARRHVSI